MAKKNKNVVSNVVKNIKVTGITGGIGNKQVFTNTVIVNGKGIGNTISINGKTISHGGNVIDNVNFGDSKEVLQYLKDNPGVKIRVVGDHVSIKRKEGRFCVTSVSFSDRKTAETCLIALEQYRSEKQKEKNVAKQKTSQKGKVKFDNRLQELAEENPEDEQLLYAIEAYNNEKENLQHKKLKTLVYGCLGVLSIVTGVFSFASGKIPTGAMFTAAGALQMAAAIMANSKIKETQEKVDQIKWGISVHCLENYDERF